MKDLGGAISEIRKAIAFDPKSVEANRALASFYISTNRAPEAETYLKAAAETAKDGGSQMALASYFVYMPRNATALPHRHAHDLSALEAVRPGAVRKHDHVVRFRR